jgi:uncharacterized membrane protein YcaP (DUF421 family)
VIAVQHAGIAHSLFTIGVPILEKALRTVAVYAGILLLLRLAGKRDLAQLNSFDLVVLLLLSNVVQNAIIGNDNSLAGGLLGAAILLAINAVVVRVVRRSKTGIKIFEGTPTVIIQDGKLDKKAINRLGLRDSEVMTAIHRQGANMLEEVEQAVLAPGGGILVELRAEAMDATKGDLARLEAKLDRLSEMLERQQP